MPSRKWFLAPIYSLFLAAALGSPVFAREMKALAGEILRSAGVEPGPALCVHLDCGDGRLTSELARAGKFLVHGLSADGETVAEARKFIQSAGIYGQASVARCSLKELPYSDNMVNFLVAEDMARLLDRGLTLKEVMRVICPLGVAYLGWPSFRARELQKRLAAAGIEEYEVVRDRGVWVRIRKPWPKEMDDWTHWRNGADRNPVARDTLAGPPAGVRWLAHPKWCVSGVGNAAMISADGRLFYSGTLGIPGVRGPLPPLLIARDAFNGLLLWTRPFPAIAPPKGGVQARRTLVAVGERVYAVLSPGRPIEALDARTGRTVMTYRDAGVPAEVLYHDDILILAGGGPVRAVDPVKGDLLWTSKSSIRPIGKGRPRPRPSIVAGEGKVYFQDDSSKELVCLEVKTGRECWRERRGGRGSICFYQEGILFLKVGDRTEAISARDGKHLWSYDGSAWYGMGKAGRRHSPLVFFSQGLCWSWNRTKDGVQLYYAGLDPSTGQVKRRVPRLAFGATGRCFPDLLSENYIFAADFNCLNLKTGVCSSPNFARPACRTSGLVANGLIYPFIQTCLCYPALHSMMGLASSKPGEPKKKAEKWEDRYEKGPAYGRTQGMARAGGEGGWPTYRHDAFRSGGATTTVPADCKALWNVKLEEKITAPVISRGKIFIASVDSHQILALGEKSGKPVWNYTAGGRINTPPTVFDGLCLFGSNDGWVTCLKAEDGELVWRFRAAPEARQIMAYGQLESAWPVHGSILVQKGTAFFAAGRHSDADGGIYIYAVDPHKGTIIWEKHHVTRGWSYKLDRETGKLLWMQPRLLQGTAHRPDLRKWTLKKVKDAADKHLFTEGGAYKVDPRTGRILWVTTPQLQNSPRMSSWQTWSAENSEDVFTSTAMRVGDLLVSDLLVGEEESFNLKTWIFDHKDGRSRYNRNSVPRWVFVNEDDKSRYTGGGRGLKSLQGGVSLLDGLSVWKCFERRNYDQYYGQGRPLVYDRERVYGAKAPSIGQARKDLFGKGTSVFAQRREEEGEIPGWTVKVRLRVLAMVVTDEVLFVAGVSDEGVIPEDLDVKDYENLDPEEFWAPLEGKKGGELWAFSRTDGKILGRQKMDNMPVFDGLAAANGRLYISTEGGRLLCFGKN